MKTTQNEAYGFFGTMREFADEAWPAAMNAIQCATGIDDEDQVATFLDSRHGRWLADEVLGEIYSGQKTAEAVQKVVAQWQAKTISRKDASEYEIPRGTPYLEGWVTHIAIEAELI
jgi:hypothetical protein